MANSKFKIFRIMESLRSSLLQTSLFLSSYRYLNDQTSTNPFKIAPKFFQAASDAAYRETILGFTRLTDENPESINFKLLLNMAENHPRLLRHSPVEVKTLVESNRRRLASLDPVLKALRPVRDHQLAHLDRKTLNNPAAVAPEPVQSQDLAQCVDILNLILSDIWQALLGEQLPEDAEADMLTQELDTLWLALERSAEKVGLNE
jgi:hypothetical protein